MASRKPTSILAVLSLASAACVGPIATSGPADLVGTTTTSSSTSTTTTTLPPATTTTTESPDEEPVDERLALGWLSPEGIPMSIIETDGHIRRVLTPCGNEAPIVLGTPLYQTTVVLDPGHGGPIDTGAWGAGGLREMDVNLRVALATQILLEQRGISVVLTRTGDYPTRLFVRSLLADTLQAELMVSIHHNAPTPSRSSRPGTEVFVQSGSEESARLGGLLWARVTRAFSIVDVAWSRARDSGVMTVINANGEDAYGMIRNPETPTALIELGYISNPAEARWFATDAYPFYAGLAVANAIVDYLTTQRPGVELGPGRVRDPLPGISSSQCVDPHLG